MQLRKAVPQRKKRNAMMKRLVAQKEIVTERKGRIKLQRKDRVITIEKF